MSRNPKTMSFDHPGSIDIVKENKIERALNGDTPHYISQVKKYGEEQVRVNFSNDDKENRQRLQDNIIFCYVVRFFEDKLTKSIGEIFDCHDSAELTVPELKEYYEETHDR